MSYSSLGSYYEGVSDYFHSIKLQHQALEYGSKALDMHEKALSIYKNSVPPTHVTLGNSYYSVGKLYLNQKQWEKAIEHLIECATIQRKHMSDELPSTLHLLEQAYAGQGNY
jgi:tetratricopeptide (TPR) repeat protein